jgi:hypothetical protein
MASDDLFMLTGEFSLCCLFYALVWCVGLVCDGSSHFVCWRSQIYLSPRYPVPTSAIYFSGVDYHSSYFSLQSGCFHDYNFNFNYLLSLLN